eukprot:scaffold15536_cov55-Attheya_sp.AAC.5
MHPSALCASPLSGLHDDAMMMLQKPHRVRGTEFQYATLSGAARPRFWSRGVSRVTRQAPKQNWRQNRTTR